jgi:hypothetical protein
MVPKPKSIRDLGDIVQQFQWVEHVVEHADRNYKIQSAYVAAHQLGSEITKQ